jgi:hypothetical protein
MNHIRRIVLISAWGVSETKKDLPGWFRWLVEHSSLRYQYHDHERQEELVQNSTLDWTAVRPVFLSNSRIQKEIIVSENNEPKPHLYISRRNLAAFMLRVLEKNLYLCQAPVVSEK